MTVTYLEDNIIEFEMVFTDPNNNDIAIDPTVVTFQFWFSSAAGGVPSPLGAVLTYSGSSTPAVNTVFRILNADGVYCYRAWIDTTGLSISGDFGTGVGKWKSTGVGQAADNDWVNIAAN